MSDTSRPDPTMTKHEQIHLLGELGMHTDQLSRGLSPIDASYIFTAFGDAFLRAEEDMKSIQTILKQVIIEASIFIAVELQSNDPDIAELTGWFVNELRAVLYVKDDMGSLVPCFFPDFIFSQARLGSETRVDMHWDEAATMHVSPFPASAL